MRPALLPTCRGWRTYPDQHSQEQQPTFEFLATIKRVLRRRRGFGLRWRVAAYSRGLDRLCTPTGGGLQAHVHDHRLGQGDPLLGRATLGDSSQQQLRQGCALIATWRRGRTSAVLHLRAEVARCPAKAAEHDTTALRCGWEAL